MNRWIATVLVLGAILGLCASVWGLQSGVHHSASTSELRRWGPQATGPRYPWISIYAAPDRAGPDPLSSLELGADGRPTTLPPDLSIELTRGGCQVECPEYSLKIDAAGVVKFGTEYGYVLRTGNVGVGPVEDLILAFRDARFFDMRDRIDDCPVDISDVREVSVSLQFASVRKRVWDDVECPGADGVEELRHVESEIDRLAGVQQWIP